MRTPICDFVNEYKNSDKMRLHMPGHKGAGFLGIEANDITEIDGADVLYNAKGIIKESEENAAKLFGTAKTLYSAEGSSLSIRAMLYLALLHGEAGGKKPIIAAGRNAHRVFMTAAALLDFEIAWIFPENSENIISCEITAEYLDAFLSGMSELPCAVYITSPDYLGNTADIKGLSDVCKKHGVLLLVDNAHGAYLNFLPENNHPMVLGADICCDSAHKTLPALTGGAYLHISKKAPEMLGENAENAMALFASTSPSYLILQSLDAVNAYIENGYRQRLAEYIKRVSALKEELAETGFGLVGSEMLKITLAPKKYGYTGIEIAQILSENGIECEFADPDFTVLMLTPENGTECLGILERILCSLKGKEAIAEKPPIVAAAKRAMSPREAIFAESEEIKIEKSLGRVLASAAVNCPPAIPIVVCGEIIDEAAIRCFEYYGIKTCRVIK